jgi:hypothetical protein
MSTSRYSKPDTGYPRPLRFPNNVAPNIRRTGLIFKSAFWALLIVDILAVTGAHDCVEAVTFSLLTLINVAVMLHITK